MRGPVQISMDGFAQMMTPKPPTKERSGAETSVRTAWSSMTKVSATLMRCGRLIVVTVPSLARERSTVEAADLSNKGITHRDVDAQTINAEERVVAREAPVICARSAER